MGKTALTFLSHSLNATAYRHLVLLAATSVALSIASGWTTWDGMENFTDNSVLSFLITFGIQGVMLVAAWLIGETFVRDSRTAAVRTAGSARRRGSLLRHVPLWSMFLVCFTASVFFSFDSLFDRIFPPEERERAGLSRAQGDVASLLNGLLARVEAHRSEVAAALFSGDQWAEYDRQLAGMISAASNLTTSVHRQQEQDARDRRDEIEALQRAVVEAEARLAAVEAETARTSREVLDAEAAEDDARARVAERERELVARQRDLRVKAAEAEAERAGVGVTGKSGEGPKFREIKRVETALQIETALSERLLTDARERLAHRLITNVLFLPIL